LAGEILGPGALTTPALSPFSPAGCCGNAGAEDRDPNDDVAAAAAATTDDAEEEEADDDEEAPVCSSGTAAR
jgi:hypothetical protein